MTEEQEAIGFVLAWLATGVAGLVAFGIIVAAHFF